MATLRMSPLSRQRKLSLRLSSLVQQTAKSWGGTSPLGSACRVLRVIPTTSTVWLRLFHFPRTSPHCIPAPATTLWENGTWIRAWRVDPLPVTVNSSPLLWCLALDFTRPHGTRQPRHGTSKPVDVFWPMSATRMRSDACTSDKIPSTQVQQIRWWYSL